MKTIDGRETAGRIASKIVAFGLTNQVGWQGN
jgi:hypothetical protein